MHTEIIQVQYVNPPKPGKKKGTIKTIDGKLFGVWANALNGFKPKETYAVEYAEEEWQGQTYRTITKATLQANGTAGSSLRSSRNTYRETKSRRCRANVRLLAAQRCDRVGQAVH